MSIRKKVYTQAYFLIKSNNAYEGSFAVRLKYIGLSTLIAGYALGRFVFGLPRLKAAEDEKFE